VARRDAPDYTIPASRLPWSVERTLRIFPSTMRVTRHLVRQIGAALIAVLLLQGSLLGADWSCATVPIGATGGSAALTHGDDLKTERHAHHGSGFGNTSAPDDQAPSHRGPMHCLATMSCAVGMVVALTADTTMPPAHERIAPVSVTTPVSVAGAPEPPPPRA